MKFSKLNSQYVVLISYKFHDDWPDCYKTICGKVSVIVYAYRQVCACKSNGRLFRHKNQLDAFIQSAYILVDLYAICKWSIPVNRMEIKPMVFSSKCLNWHKWEIENQDYAGVMTVY